MNKKLTRTLAGVMSLMFMGQVMIFGDGKCSCQFFVHAHPPFLFSKTFFPFPNSNITAREHHAISNTRTNCLK